MARSRSRIEQEKEKAYEKARKRSRSRAARKSAKDAERRSKQRVIAYTAEGERIGDDGYVMTKARKRLHRTYDFFFIWMIVCFLAAAVCIVNSLFQNQTITEWELVWVGGNMFGNYPVATLLRIEALFLLWLTALSLTTNMKGMAWLYDNGPKRSVQVTTVLLFVPSAIYFLISVFLVGIPEPASLITAIAAVLIYVFVPAVETERSTLRKAKVARTVVKD